MRSDPRAGYTLIEVLVAIILAGMLFIGLFSSLSNILAISAGSSHRQGASNLAYSNMRLYADGSAPLWFSCNTSNETETITLLDEAEVVDGLPGVVTQTVTSQAPYGCDDARKGYPVLVTSTVELTSGVKATHATYVPF